MKKGQVKLIRRHFSGFVKIKDRKFKVDEKGETMLDQETKKPIIEIYHHRLSVDAYKKAFKVTDLDYVLEQHGSILEEV
jgi:hypothetical protein